MKNGKLIVVEGACDGIGKSTQYKLLLDYLKSEGYEVVSHHFPTYESKEGALAESYLNGDFGNPSKLSPYFVNSIYAIDRAITWNKTLKKEFDDGKIILLDRYTTSSIIYQSALMNIHDKEKFIDYVDDYEYNKLGLKRPDLVLFLDAPFDLVTKMRNERKVNDGIESDIHESNLNFMKMVYDNALYVSEKLDFCNINCSKNNNEMKSIDEIHKDIISKVKKI